MLSGACPIRIFCVLATWLVVSGAVAQTSTEVKAELTSIKDTLRFEPQRSAQRLEMLLKQPAASTSPLRDDILLTLGNARFFAGELPEAARIAKEVERININHGDNSLLSKSYLLQGYALSQGFSEIESLKLFREAKSLADKSGDLNLKVQASLSLGEILIDTGNSKEGLSFINSAVELSEKSNDVGAKVMALGTRARRIVAMDDYNGALRDIDQLVSQAGQSGNAALQARARQLEFIVASKIGQSTRALSALTSEIRLLRFCRCDEALGDALFAASDLYIQRKNYSAALKTSAEAISLSKKNHKLESANWAEFNHGIANIYLGRVDAGRNEIEPSLRNMDIHNKSSVLLTYATALAYAGDIDSAFKNFSLADDLIYSNYSKEEHKQHELTKLQNKNLRQTIELREQESQRWRWAAYATSSTVTLCLFGFFTTNLRKKNKLLAIQQNELSIKNERLQWQSQHDALTGVFNRRFFEEYVSQHSGGDVKFANNAKSTQLEGALFLIDVDHFKRINDGFGHANGDLVLKEVTRRIKCVLRNQDILVRWGGEEFLVFLPEANSSASTELVERMLHAVSSALIAIDGDEIQVTVSVGYCPAPIFVDGTKMSWESSIRVADAALYFAKQSGRNRAYGVEGPAGLSSTVVAKLQSNFGAALAAGLVHSRTVDGSRATLYQL